MSPAVTAAMNSMRTAIEAELKANGGNGGSLGAGDKMADDLKEQIATLQKKLAEVNSAREKAETELAAIKAKPAPGFFASMCKCLTEDDDDEAPKAAGGGKADSVDTAAMAEASAALKSEWRGKITKAFEGATEVKMSKDGSKTMQDAGVDSIMMQVATQSVAKTMDMTEEELMEKVPVDEKTTVNALVDKLVGVAVDKAMVAKFGPSAAGVAAAAATTTAAAAAPPAAPAVPKMSAAELLEMADMSHLGASAVGDIAACKKAVEAGRPATLSFLKENGVAKLQERQKLATALAKALREDKL